MASFAVVVKTNTESGRGTRPYAPQVLLGMAPGTPEDRDWKAVVDESPNFGDQSIALPKLGSFKLSRVMPI